MAREIGTVEHADACKAVAFITGIPSDQVIGYAVIVMLRDDEIKITGNQSTKAGTVAYIADGLARLSLDLAEDLADMLIG